MIECCLQISYSRRSISRETALVHSSRIANLGLWWMSRLYEIKAGSEAHRRSSLQKLLRDGQPLLLAEAECLLPVYLLRQHPRPIHKVAKVYLLEHLL